MSEVETLREEVAALRHDIERHQKIAAELATENEALREKADQIAYVRLQEALSDVTKLEGSINEAWQWARLPEDVHRELMAVLHDTRSNLQGVLEGFMDELNVIEE